MKQKTETQNELDATGKRLGELTAMRDELDANMKTLQSGFVAGTVPLDDLQAGHSKLMVLNGSIDSLEETRAELQTLLDKTVQAETRAAQLVKAKAIALETDQSYRGYLKYRCELNESIQTIGGKMVDSISQFFNQQYELKNTLTAIEPKLSYSELELPKEMADLVSGAARSVSPLEYGDAVQLVENRIANERQSEAQTQRAAEQAAKAGSK